MTSLIVIFKTGGVALERHSIQELRHTDTLDIWALIPIIWISLAGSVQHPVC